MRNHIGATLVIAAVVLSGLFAMPARSAEIVIATGEQGTLFHQVGRAICHLLRRNADDLSCFPLRTAAGDTTASVANLNNVLGGAVELGLVQAETQFNAVNRSGPFEFTFESYDNLRAVFSLHSEDFTLLARADSEIRSIDDLRHRRANIGNPGSVTRQLV